MASTSSGRPDCSFPDCPRPHKGRGLCGGHLAQLRKGKKLTPLRRYEKGRKCEFRNCGRRHYALGLCKGHYAQQDRGEELAPLGRQREPRLNHDGYVVEYWPGHPNAMKGGMILQHRRVMSDMLGRPLLPGERPHHKNGVRHDNRPENLELWVTFQPAGQRPDDLLEWADEIVRRYRPTS